MHETSIGVLCDFSRVVIEANPGGGHDVRVDVIKEVLNAQIFHLKVQTIIQLLFDEVQVLGEE